MRILILIDAIHTGETLESLAKLVPLDKAELLLAYVRGPSGRAALELVGHRPGGGHRLPPHRERELSEAELIGDSAAIAEAEALARGYSSAVQMIEVRGEPGRAICDLAGRQLADVVIIRAGGRDRPPMGPRSLGPTARFITDHSPIPVLLLRNR